MHIVRITPPLLLTHASVTQSSTYTVLVRPLFAVLLPTAWS